jgi:hypothetical protein
LTQKGTVIPQRLICRLTKDECSEPDEVKAAKRSAFNADITAKLGDSVKLPSTPLSEFVEPDLNAEPHEDNEEDNEFPTLKPFEADIVDAAGRPIMMHFLTDVLINAEVLLDKDDSAALERVVYWAADSDGKSIGQCDEEH